MHIPLVDLNAQYTRHQSRSNAAMQTGLNETSFILGPAVTRFDTKFRTVLPGQALSWRRRAVPMRYILFAVA